MVMLLTLGGCGRPRAIPDDTLAQIFKESFLANAYYGTHSFVPTDSIDIYRPILEKYGYTHKDLERTIADFSKQKSAKLSDILEQAIKELQADLDYYNERVAVLDTVNARAARMFSREVYFVEQIAARKIADTAKLRITIPVEPGKYHISYTYYIDSLDQNRSLQTIYSLIDSTGRLRNISSTWLNLRRRQQQSTEIETSTGDRKLEILFGAYKKDMTKPHLTVDSLRIIHFLPIDVALDSVIRKFTGINIPPHGTIQSTPKDSSALRLYPLWYDTVGSGDH